MADPKGFMKYQRELPESRSPKVRIDDYKEIYEPFPTEKTINQAARCMDCGVPFCHSGCPLGNVIPEFNDAIYRSDFAEAFSILSETNNFPEFTGRICPAPCEAACVLGINQSPVSIEHIEKSIVEEAYERGLIRPQPPTTRTGKKVAIVGSGPAGLAAADQLNRAGHLVTVFERKDRVGGLLRYGIPDFKLEKWVLERRLGIMEAEGIRFKTNAHVGVNVDPQWLEEQFDAVLLCGGSTVPRDLDIPGRNLEGIHFAMEYLEQSNRRIAGDPSAQQEVISAHGKNVLVIGGGDTGSDCVGTANRQKATQINQIELLAKPPAERDPLSWPNWPMVMRTSSSHEEGVERDWAILTKAFLGDETGKVKAAQTVQVEWTKDPVTGKHKLSEIPGTESDIACDLVFLAVGFVHPEQKGMLEQLGLQTDARKNVLTSGYHTSREGIFAAGDMRRGQSLVVWAISEGREAAHEIDVWLMGESTLPTKDDSMFMVHD
ncbi:MAG: glutamate synthase subunit beta [Saprospiraceae bacterium]|nr:glutamate synthase subunit beta [Saprospiraceae bacterium]